MPVSRGAEPHRGGYPRRLVSARQAGAPFANWAFDPAPGALGEFLARGDRRADHCHVIAIDSLIMLKDEMLGMIILGKCPNSATPEPGAITR